MHFRCSIMIQQVYDFVHLCYKRNGIAVLYNRIRRIDRFANIYKLNDFRGIVFIANS